MDYINHIFIYAEQRREKKRIQNPNQYDTTKKIFSRWKRVLQIKIEIFQRL